LEAIQALLETVVAAGVVLYFFAAMLYRTPEKQSATPNSNPGKFTPMISAQRKKRLYRPAGLMFVLILGLLWTAEQYMPAGRPARTPSQSADASATGLPLQPAWMTRTISALGPGQAHAADVSQPALVRKKLPAPMPETPSRAEPLPGPTAPAVEPAARVPEKPERPAPAEPAPPAAASTPEPGPGPAPAVAAPARPEPPKSEKPGIPESRAAYPFSILLSSCKEMENARAALSGYRRAGLTAYIVQTDLAGKGLWWRILTGHYRNLAEALQARQALKLVNAVVVKTPFANLIGQYGTETEAAAAAARLTPKDVFAYTVKGPGNSFQLMAGAFPSQQAAAIYRRELEAKGISTRIIQR